MDAEHRRSASSLLTFFLPFMYVVENKPNYYSYSIQAPKYKLASITRPVDFDEATSESLYLTAEKEALFRFTRLFGTNQNCPWNLTDYVSCIRGMSAPHGKFRAFVNFGSVNGASHAVHFFCGSEETSPEESKGVKFNFCEMSHHGSLSVDDHGLSVNE
jgi:hypothetical protein